MLQFNELRITPDGNYLIIDVQVQNLDFYKDVHIDSLYIDAFPKGSEFKSFPNENSILVWKSSDTEQGDSGILEYNTVKHISKIIDIKNFKDSIFFVYAIAEGNPTDATPDSCKDRTIRGVTYDKKLIYTNSINSLRTGMSCNPDKNFIDYILNYKKFELSIKTGDCHETVKRWNQILKGYTPIHKECECHGY